MTQAWVSRFPRPVEEVYACFSDPRRLKDFTPPFLRLELLAAPRGPLVPGMLVDYRLTWHGIPFQWRTRIEEVEPNRRFVDAQLSGPYRRFVHTHEFYAVEGGTLMVDRLEWQLHLEPLSGPVNALVVRPSLDEVFRFRAAQAERTLGPATK